MQNGSKARTKTISKLFVLHHVLANREKFGKADALVLSILCEYTSGIYGTAWPAVGTIAEVGQLGVRTVQTSLRRLEAAGIICTVEGGGRNRPNTYRVQFDAVDRSPFSERIKQAAERARNSAPFRGDAAHLSEEETPQTFALNPADLCTKPRRLLHPNPFEEPKEIKPSAYAGSPCGDPLTQNNARQYENVGGRLGEIQRWLKSNQPRRLEANHLQQLLHWSAWCDDIAEAYDGKVGDRIGGWAGRLADELQGRIEDATEDIESEEPETATASDHPIAQQGKSEGDTGPGMANVSEFPTPPPVKATAELRERAMKAKLYLSQGQTAPPGWENSDIRELVRAGLLTEDQAERLYHQAPAADTASA